jgi:hypothetical protein
MRAFSPSLAVIATFAISVCTASAAIQVEEGDNVKLTRTGAKHIGSGGEFQVVDQTALIAPSFYTFCLEKSENATAGTVYYVEDISEVAVKGGTGTAAGGWISNTEDRICRGTSWLYQEYNDFFFPDDGDDLTDFVVNYTHVGVEANNWGAALQNVFWFLEEEISDKYFGFTGNNAVTDKIDEIWTEVIDSNNIEHYWKPILNGEGSVRVMNITTLAGADRQSQLIDVPDEENIPTDDPVPEPGTLCLWGGLAVAGFFAARRRGR